MGKCREITFHSWLDSSIFMYLHPCCSVCFGLLEETTRFRLHSHSNTPLVMESRSCLEICGTCFVHEIRMAIEVAPFLGVFTRFVDNFHLEGVLAILCTTNLHRLGVHVAQCALNTLGATCQHAHSYRVEYLRAFASI